MSDVNATEWIDAPTSAGWWWAYGPNITPSPLQAMEVVTRERCRMNVDGEFEDYLCLEIMVNAMKSVSLWEFGPAKWKPIQLPDLSEIES